MDHPRVCQSGCGEPFILQSIQSPDCLNVLDKRKQSFRQLRNGANTSNDKIPFARQYDTVQARKQRNTCSKTSGELQGYQEIRSCTMGKPNIVPSRSASITDSVMQTHVGNGRRATTVLKRLSRLEKRISHEECNESSQTNSSRRTTQAAPISRSNTSLRGGSVASLNVSAVQKIATNLQSDKYRTGDSSLIEMRQPQGALLSSTNDPQHRLRPSRLVHQASSQIKGKNEQCSFKKPLHIELGCSTKNLQNDKCRKEPCHKVCEKEDSCTLMNNTDGKNPKCFDYAGEHDICSSSLLRSSPLPSIAERLTQLKMSLEDYRDNRKDNRSVNMSRIQRRLDDTYRKNREQSSIADLDAFAEARHVLAILKYHALPKASHVSVGERLPSLGKCEVAPSKIRHLAFDTQHNYKHVSKRIQQFREGLLTALRDAKERLAQREAHAAGTSQNEMNCLSFVLSSSLNNDSIYRNLSESKQRVHRRLRQLEKLKQWKDSNRMTELSTNDIMEQHMRKSTNNQFSKTEHRDKSIAVQREYASSHCYGFLEAGSLDADGNKIMEVPVHLTMRKCASPRTCIISEPQKRMENAVSDVQLINMGSGGVVKKYDGIRDDVILQQNIMTVIPRCDSQAKHIRSGGGNGSGLHSRDTTVSVDYLESFPEQSIGVAIDYQHGSTDNSKSTLRNLTVDRSSSNVEASKTTLILQRLKGARQGQFQQDTAGKDSILDPAPVHRTTGFSGSSLKLQRKISNISVAKEASENPNDLFTLTGAGAALTAVSENGARSDCASEMSNKISIVSELECIGVQGGAVNGTVDHGIPVSVDMNVTENSTGISQFDTAFDCAVSPTILSDRQPIQITSQCQHSSTGNNVYNLTVDKTIVQAIQEVEQLPVRQYKGYETFECKLPNLQQRPTCTEWPQDCLGIISSSNEPLQPNQNSPGCHSSLERSETCVTAQCCENTGNNHLNEPTIKYTSGGCYYNVMRTIAHNYTEDRVTSDHVEFGKASPGRADCCVDVDYVNDRTQGADYEEKENLAHNTVALIHDNQQMTVQDEKYQYRVKMLQSCTACSESLSTEFDLQKNHFNVSYGTNSSTGHCDANDDCFSPNFCGSGVLPLSESQQVQDAGGLMIQEAHNQEHICHGALHARDSGTEANGNTDASEDVDRIITAVEFLLSAITGDEKKICSFFKLIKREVMPKPPDIFSTGVKIGEQDIGISDTSVKLRTLNKHNSCEYHSGMHDLNPLQLEQLSLHGRYCQLVRRKPIENLAGYAKQGNTNLSEISAVASQLENHQVSGSKRSYAELDGQIIDGNYRQKTKVQALIKEFELDSIRPSNSPKSQEHESFDGKQFDYAKLGGPEDPSQSQNWAKVGCQNIGNTVDVHQIGRIYSPGHISQMDENEGNVPSIAGCQPSMQTHSINEHRELPKVHPGQVDNFYRYGKLAVLDRTDQRFQNVIKLCTDAVSTQQKDFCPEIFGSTGERAPIAESRTLSRINPLNASLQQTDLHMFSRLEENRSAAGSECTDAQLLGNKIFQQDSPSLCYSPFDIDIAVNNTTLPNGKSASDGGLRTFVKGHYGANVGGRAPVFPFGRVRASSANVHVNAMIDSPNVPTHEDFCPSSVSAPAISSCLTETTDEFLPSANPDPFLLTFSESVTDVLEKVVASPRADVVGDSNSSVHLPHLSGIFEFERKDDNEEEGTNVNEFPYANVLTDSKFMSLRKQENMHRHRLRSMRYLQRKQLLRQLNHLPAHEYSQKKLLANTPLGVQYIHDSGCQPQMLQQGVQHQIKNVDAHESRYASVLSDVRANNQENMSKVNTYSLQEDPQNLEHSKATVLERIMSSDHLYALSGKTGLSTEMCSFKKSPYVKQKPASILRSTIGVTDGPKSVKQRNSDSRSYTVNTSTLEPLVDRGSLFRCNYRRCGIEDDLVVDTSSSSYTQQNIISCKDSLVNGSVYGDSMPHTPNLNDNNFSPRNNILMIEHGLIDGRILCNSSNAMVVRHPNEFDEGPNGGIIEPIFGMPEEMDVGICSLDKISLLTKKQNGFIYEADGQVEESGRFECDISETTTANFSSSVGTRQSLVPYDAQKSADFVCVDKNRKGYLSIECPADVGDWLLVPKGDVCTPPSSPLREPLLPKSDCGTTVPDKACEEMLPSTQGKCQLELFATMSTTSSADCYGPTTGSANFLDFAIPHLFASNTLLVSNRDSEVPTLRSQNIKKQESHTPNVFECGENDVGGFVHVMTSDKNSLPPSTENVTMTPLQLIRFSAKSRMLRILRKGEQPKETSKSSSVFIVRDEEEKDSASTDAKCESMERASTTTNGNLLRKFVRRCRSPFRNSGGNKSGKVLYK